MTQSNKNHLSHEISNSDAKYFELFKSHAHFGLKVRQELKRAERYCEFVSLITINIQRENRIESEFDNSESGFDIIERMQEGLRKLICRSIRITDYVSGIENDMMGLLLVETSKEGASVFLERLKSIINGYLSPYYSEECPTDISYLTVSFPDENHDKNEFAHTIREFIRD
ncbi:MAG: hypothetical protein GY855_15665 [candidate division Zixibacteria bacterium]|nr:hypothetical protein [candidate division Zixibacteria bacterium]